MKICPKCKEAVEYDEVFGVFECTCCDWMENKSEIPIAKDMFGKELYLNDKVVYIKSTPSSYNNDSLSFDIGRVIGISDTGLVRIQNTNGEKRRRSSAKVLKYKWDLKKD